MRELQLDAVTGANHVVHNGLMQEATDTSRAFA